jgi:hypothetical protein
MAAARQKANEPGTFEPLTVNVDRELKIWLSVQSAKEQITMGALVSKALLDYRRKAEKGKKS